MERYKTSERLDLDIFLWKNGRNLGQIIDRLFAPKVVMNFQMNVVNYSSWQSLVYSVV